MTHPTEPNFQQAEEHIAPGVRVSPAALRFNFVRASGPGGQHVNKLNTKAQLTVDLADLAPHLSEPAMQRLRRQAGRYLHQEPERLILEAQDHRSQHANRQHCLDKLRDLIVRAKAPPKRRKKTRPPRRVKEQRLKGKKHRGQIKRLRGRPPRDA